MLPNCFNPKTNKNLSSGEALAITFNLLTICLKLSLLFNDISTAPVFSSFFLVRFPQTSLKISPSNAIGFSLLVISSEVNLFSLFTSSL